MLRLSFLVLLLSHLTHCMLLGWVESPGYPNGYSPHASLNWSRCAPEGHTLSIRLIHLDLEDSPDCENDGVKIYSNGNLISILCGTVEFEELQTTVNPLLLSSSGGCLSLSFYSDYSNTKRHAGFRGFYTIQDFDECMDDSSNKCTQFCHNYIGGYHCSCRHGYHMAEDKHTCTVSCNEDLSGLSKGDISSPSWPGSYADNANCQYTLSVDSHFQVVLHFSEVFDVEQSPDGQCIDALSVETPSGTLGPFCGHTPPPSPLLTHANKIKIRFTSDSFGTNKGFSLHFGTKDKVCPAVVTSASTVTPQKPEYYRGHIVTVTCDDGYAANNPAVQMMTSYKTTCQSTGIWTPTYTCEPVDCGLPDIREDGILQLVGSVGSHTQYEHQIQFNCTSKYYRLEGDDTYTCSANGEWVSVNGKTELPKCVPVCGIPEKLIAGAGRILGGTRAELGEIPWQLLIKTPTRGGASLINDQWAVTAAHVVDGFEKTPLTFFGGLIDGQTSQLGRASTLNSERIIIHPDYAKGITNAQRINYDNDIALVRFTSRVTFGPNLLPICLPEGNGGVFENVQGTVSGWGATAKRDIARFLQYAHTAVKALDVCKNTPTFPPNSAMVFTDNMFCAGAEGKDSCKGDSGGPFVLPMLSAGTGPYYLTGIVSWGDRCDNRGYKGYYTKVENYVEWIKMTIEQVETELSSRDE